MSIQKDLQKYLLQSNVINLAIAVSFGQTFSAFISSIVTNIIYPLLSFIFYNIDFAKMNLKIGKNTIDYGDVINKGLTFFITMTTVFFIFIRPLNRIIEKNENNEK